MKKPVSILLLLLALFATCRRSDFADYNTNPDVILNVKPETEMTSGMLGMFNNSIEVFYDFNQGIRYWTQTFVGATGNPGTVYETPGNINTRWDIFYKIVAPNLVDAQKTIDKMAADKKAQYQFMRAVITIPLAYYAFYVSDADNYIPYSSAIQARYTSPPNLTPAYDTQKDLFDTLDAQLKSAVAVLKSTPTVAQVSPGNNDIFYNGDWTKWVKAANSLRLKIAIRLLKRDAARTTAIANEVLTDNVGIIDDISNEWVFNAVSSFNLGGNANPEWIRLASGEKYVIDFMSATSDPRMRNFYKPSGISTKDLFDSAKAKGILPASMIWDNRKYRGAWASPDNLNLSENVIYRTSLTFSYHGKDTSVYWASHIQQRMFWALDDQVAGETASQTASNSYPVITYADVCFMRAELKQRGLSNDKIMAKDLYEKGVAASIAHYDTWAQRAQVIGYTGLSANEINNYLKMPGVAFDPANALEQICNQAFLEYFLHPNEAWAIEKRTGYPSPNGIIMKIESPKASGAVLSIPRRMPITSPVLGDLNYTNAINAINAMEKDPNFGQPLDIYGRVWWDVP